MTKYEYCMVYYTESNKYAAINKSKSEPIAKNKFLLDLFNQLGNDGWHFCHSIKISSSSLFADENYYYYFERLLND